MEDADKFRDMVAEVQGKPGTNRHEMYLLCEVVPVLGQTEGEGGE